MPQTTLGDPATTRSYPGTTVSTRGPSGVAGLDRRASAAPAVAPTMTQQRQRRVTEWVMTVFLAHSKRRFESDYNPDHGVWIGDARSLRCV